MKKEQACTEMKMEQFESGNREYWVENSVRDLYWSMLSMGSIQETEKQDKLLC